MNAQAWASASVNKRLDDLRRNLGENLSLDEIGNMAAAIVHEVCDSASHEHERLVAELRSILDYVAGAKQELASLGPKNLSAKEIPAAADQLDAIVLATEEAVTTIMDAAEKMEEVAEKSGEKEAAELRDISMTLFEASSFQDICGQRITKVMTMLRVLEEKLSALAESLGDTQIDEADEEVTFDADGLVEDDKRLLDGPQLEGEGTSQAEIDAIMAEFD